MSDAEYEEHCASVPEGSRHFVFDSALSLLEVPTTAAAWRLWLKVLTSVACRSRPGGRPENRPICFRRRISRGFHSWIIRFAQRIEGLRILCTFCVGGSLRILGWLTYCVLRIVRRTPDFGVACVLRIVYYA